MGISDIKLCNAGVCVCHYVCVIMCVCVCSCGGNVNRQVERGKGRK